MRLLIRSQLRHGPVVVLLLNPGQARGELRGLLRWLSMVLWPKELRFRRVRRSWDARPKKCTAGFWESKRGGPGAGAMRLTEG